MTEFWDSPVAIILAVTVFYCVVRKMDGNGHVPAYSSGSRFGHTEAVFAL